MNSIKLQCAANSPAKEQLPRCITATNFGTNPWSVVFSFGAGSMGVHASMGFAVTARTRNPFVGKFGPKRAASELNSSIIYKEFRFLCQYNVTLHKKKRAEKKPRVHYVHSSSCIVRFYFSVVDLLELCSLLAVLCFVFNRQLDDVRLSRQFFSPDWSLVYTQGHRQCSH